MFRLNNIKHNVLILSFATLLAGCGGGGTATTTDSTSTNLTTTLTEKVVKIDILVTATEDSATIEWNPYGYTTKSVEYGTSNKYGSVVAVQEEGTVTLSNLQANTEYHYRTVSEDERGRLIVSNDNTFTTLASTQPIVTDPVPTDPIVTESVPTDPIVTEPVPTDPIVTEPAPTDPIVTEPVPTDPIVTEPVPTDPIVTEPAPTETNTTEPAVTELAPTVPVVTDPSPVCQSGSAIQQGQVKDSISGAGLANVTVTINGCITITDENGFYTLTNITATDNAVVNFKKEGYLHGSSEIQIKELSDDGTTSPNYLEYALDTHDYQWSYDSQTSASGANINIPASIYTDTVGELYTGTVSVALKIQDITTDIGKALFPGSFEGKSANGDMQQFVSYGLISLSFKDTNGNPLNFAEGSIVTLKFDAVASTGGQNIIPLWYYDYLQGLWIEEGYAELQADGTYQGEISHPGTWSLNQPIENAPAIYRGRILYEDGKPAQDVRVSAIGNNWISTDFSTDKDGVFEIEVIPGNSFQLTAYNYKDKYEAKYNATISAIASGEIVENRM